MNDKNVFRLIMFLSTGVIGLIIILYSLPRAEIIPNWAKNLPLLNACLNGSCSFLLIASLISIKNKNIVWHKRLNLTAFGFSALFLASYVVFHSYGVETRFPINDPARPFYLVILLTHILFAAIVLPLVLASFYLGLSDNIERHKKVSRFTYPIWLYTTITGVVVYYMISPYYQF